MSTDLRIDADNRPGALAAIASALGEAGVNIEGYCGAAEGGRGVVHLLVDDAGGARRALEATSFSVAAEHEALIVDGEDRPGYLGEVARKLGDSGINVEVGYVATNTRLVFVVDDADRARTLL